MQRMHGPRQMIVCLNIDIFLAMILVKTVSVEGVEGHWEPFDRFWTV